MHRLWVTRNKNPFYPHKQKVILQIDISSPRVTMKEKEKELIVTVKVLEDHRDLIRGRCMLCRSQTCRFGISNP